MARWLLKGPNGEREQVCTRGKRTPAEDGANPGGWREIKVAAHSPNLDAHDFDEGTRRWRKCPVREASRSERLRDRALAWLDAMPAGAIDIIAEAVAGRLAGAAPIDGEKKRSEQ